MKIVLNDKSELNVSRINMNITNSPDVSSSLMITFKKNTSIEEVNNKINDDTIKSFTLVRDDCDDKVYEGYSIQNISEDSLEDGDTVNLFLIKFKK